MVAPSIDLSAFDVLTFDCYGTLIDWESGLLAAARPVLDAHGVMDVGRRRDPRDLRASRGRARVGRVPHLPRGAGPRAPRGGRRPRLRAERRRGGARSRARWATGPRSPTARRRSTGCTSATGSRRSRTATTTCSPRSARRLGVDFDWVITAQQARSYKPSAQQLRAGLRADRRSAGAHPARGPEPLPRPRDGQAPGHDHGVGRPPPGTRGSGATPPAEARPDLTVPDMRTLADLAAG